MSDPSKTELIHTSCRSESSNISLVVLDKDEKSPQHNNKFVSDNRFEQVFILLFFMATGLHKYCFTVLSGVLKETVSIHQIVLISSGLVQKKEKTRPNKGVAAAAAHHTGKSGNLHFNALQHKTMAWQSFRSKVYARKLKKSTKTIEK